MATFILNDQSAVNSYGFRVLTAGIRLDRFLKNPVMLDGHANNTASVVGRWGNVQKKNGLLSADTDFDEADPAAKLLSGKVERGYIKGASIGILIDEKGYKKGADGVMEVHSCELMEASICAIPANGNAISIFASTGEKIDPKNVQLQLQKMAVKPPKTPMEFLQKMAEMLGLTSTATEEEVIAALQSLKDAKDKEAKLAAENLVATAMQEGRITAADKAHFEKLAMADFSLAQITLQKLSPRVSLAAQVVNVPAGDWRELAGGAKKTTLQKDRKEWKLDDYRKYAPAELAANPALYDRLIEEEFGK